MRSNRSIIVVLATALFLVAVGCAQHQAPVDQFKETQAQMAELQKSLANMNLRLEELNNSVFILQETSKANRESIRELKRDQQKPTVFITPGQFRHRGDTCVRGKRKPLRKRLAPVP